MIPSRPTANRHGRRLILGALFAAAFLAGLGVRLHRLETRTITHPEFWVPGIEVPAHVSHPPPRMNAAQVLRQTLAIDKHPPGYHLVMLAWNSLFGTGILAMRLSSLLFGMSALVAVYLYGRRAEGAGVAVLATWMLALHGYHVMWSQHLRPWAMLSFLAVISSLLLLRIEERWRPGLAVCYSLLVAFGLWVDYYFWPILAAQILWILLKSGGSRYVSPVLWAQTLALLLATPVFLFIYQQMGTGSHLPTEIWPFVVFMLQFGGALNTGWFTNRLPELAPWISALVAGAGAIALVAGLRTRARRSSDAAEASPNTHAAPGTVWLFVAALLVVLVIELVFVPLMGRRRITVAVALTPWLLALGWVLLKQVWPHLSRFLSAIVRQPIIRHAPRDLTAVMALAVFLMLAAVHLVKPVLAEHGLVTLAPFYLVLTARGVLAAPRGRRLLIAAVVGFFVLSAYQWGTAWRSNRDYKQLAERLMPHVREGDVVLVEDEWWTAPIHYYLKPGRYRVIPPPAADSAAAGRPVDAQLPDRVWIIDFGPHELLEQRLAAIAARLPSFEPGMRLSAYNAGAVMYQRRERVE